MLMAVRNQIKVSLLSVKYALMREMLNKVTFVTNIVFMILNNACFIVQWIIIYSLKDSIGDYGLKEVILLWGIASFSFGCSHFFFKRAFSISDTINKGKLDAAIVQPKNILLSIITSDVEVSAIGDILYGYIMLIIYGLSLERFLLFTFLGFSGSLITVSLAVIVGSLSFWIRNSESVADSFNGAMISFSTYPDSIFNGIVKILFYTIIPIEFANYIPLRVIITFDIVKFVACIGAAVLFILIAFIIFYRGLKRYSSSSLMESRI